MPFPHPATRILMWVLLAISLSWFDVPALLCVSAAFVVGLMAFGGGVFFRLLRRARFLLVSMIVIYALSYPGHLMLPGLGALSPTQEGLHMGLLQAWKLLLLLAGLGLLHVRCDRECLLTGLLGFLWPLRHLGVNAGRAASRMALTLEYAEDAARWTRQEWKRLLTDDADLAIQVETTVMTVQLASLRMADYVLLASGAALLGALAVW